MFELERGSTRRRNQTSGELNKKSSSRPTVEWLEQREVPATLVGLTTTNQLRDFR